MILKNCRWSECPSLGVSALVSIWVIDDTGSDTVSRVNSLAVSFSSKIRSLLPNRESSRSPIEHQHRTVRSPYISNIQYITQFPFSSVWLNWTVLDEIQVTRLLHLFLSNSFWSYTFDTQILCNDNSRFLPNSYRSIISVSSYIARCYTAVWKEVSDLYRFATRCSSKKKKVGWIVTCDF